MKKILHIISSPRGAASFSIRLGNAIVDKLMDAYPGSTVKITNLVEKNFPQLEESHINSFYTPAEARTPELVAAVRHSDEAIAEILEADIIVLGAPMYNFSIHSSLKAWLDHVVRSGATFQVDAEGVHGLIKGKKVYIAMSSGFTYSEGPMKSHDFLWPYLQMMLSFIGMTDLHLVRVEGTSAPETKDSALAKAIAGFEVDSLVTV